MKTLKSNLKSSMFIFCLCLGVLAFSKCGSDEDPEPEQNEGPCAEFECQNGGTSYKDVEYDVCRCKCPTGYTGEHCETKK